MVWQGVDDCVDAAVLVFFVSGGQLHALQLLQRDLQRNIATASCGVWYIQ